MSFWFIFHSFVLCFSNHWSAALFQLIVFTQLAFSSGTIGNPAHSKRNHTLNGPFIAKQSSAKHKNLRDVISSMGEYLVDRLFDYKNLESIYHSLKICISSVCRIGNGCFLLGKSFWLFNCEIRAERGAGTGQGERVIEIFIPRRPLSQLQNFTDLVNISIM